MFQSQILISGMSTRVNNKSFVFVQRRDCLVYQSLVTHFNREEHPPAFEGGTYSILEGRGVGGTHLQCIYYLVLYTDLDSRGYFGAQHGFSEWYYENNIQIWRHCLGRRVMEYSSKFQRYITQGYSKPWIIKSMPLIADDLEWFSLWEAFCEACVKLCMILWYDRRTAFISKFVVCIYLENCCEKFCNIIK